MTMPSSPMMAMNSTRSLTTSLVRTWIARRRAGSSGSWRGSASDACGIGGGLGSGASAKGHDTE